LEGGDPKHCKSNTDKFQCRFTAKALQPFNLSIPGADARKPGVGAKFYPAYSDDVAKKISTALSVKASWIVNAPCSDTYAVICASSLFKAANDLINAINLIRNHDCCCKRQSGGDDDQASNVINVEYETLVKVLAFSDDVATVDPGENQEPTAPGPDAV
jgi:hypothetical protein